MLHAQRRWWTIAHVTAKPGSVLGKRSLRTAWGPLGYTLPTSVLSLLPVLPFHSSPCMPPRCMYTCTHAQVKELLSHQRAAINASLDLKKRGSSGGRGGKYGAEAKLHRQLRIIGGTAINRKLLSSQGSQTRPMMEKVGAHASECWGACVGLCGCKLRCACVWACVWVWV